MKRLSTYASVTIALAAACFVHPALGADSGSWSVETHLSRAESGRLKQLVEKDRTARQDAYKAVADVKLALPSMNHPGRMPPVSQHLRRLGSKARLPLVAEIVTPKRDGGFSDHLWLAWRIGVVEALGELRDPSLGPLLLATLKSSSEPDLAVVAAAAYAKLGTDDVAASLVSLSKPGAATRFAVLSAMGHCRRLSVAASPGICARLQRRRENPNGCHRFARYNRVAVGLAKRQCPRVETRKRCATPRRKRSCTCSQRVRQRYSKPLNKPCSSWQNRRCSSTSALNKKLRPRTPRTNRAACPAPREQSDSVKAQPWHALPSICRYSSRRPMTPRMKGTPSNRRWNPVSEELQITTFS